MYPGVPVPGPWFESKVSFIGSQRLRIKDPFLVTSLSSVVEASSREKCRKKGYHIPYRYTYRSANRRTMDDYDEKSDSKHGEDSKADSKVESKQSLTGLEVLLKVEEYFYGNT